MSQKTLKETKILPLKREENQRPLISTLEHNTFSLQSFSKKMCPKFT